MKAATMGATSVIRIEEEGGSRRVLELKGPSLPLQGVEWSGITTLAIQWNPGNPEATQHVLGPQELPTTMKGVWRTNQLAATPASFTDESGTHTVTYAYTLATILDSLRIDAQLCKVTWFNRITGTDSQGNANNREHRIFRRGRISSFKPSYDRIDDIAWELTFDWIGRGEPPAKLVDDSEDLVAKLRASNIAASAAAAKIESGEIFGERQTRLFPQQFTLGQLEALVDAPKKLVNDFARAANGISNRLQHLGDLIIKIKETPAAILGRATDAAIDAVAVANQFLDQMSRQGAETITTRNKVSALTRSYSHLTGAMREAENVRNTSNDLARTLRRRNNAGAPGVVSGAASDASARDILAVHIPRDGDTFIGLSIHYYRTELYGAVLARVNGYPGYTIAPPKRRPVIIPALRVIEGRAAGKV